MSSWRSALRSLVLMLAAVGLFANGAQAHVQVRSPDSLEVPMCGNGSGHVVQIGVGDPTPVDTGHETCCGDCLVADIVAPPAAGADVALVGAEYPVAQAPVSVAFPRSPLWPGAPPLGPPVSFKV